MNNFKASEDLSPHHQFQTFIDIFTNTVNLHAPYRRTTSLETNFQGLGLGLGLGLSLAVSVLVS